MLDYFTTEEFEALQAATTVAKFVSTIFNNVLRRESAAALIQAKWLSHYYNPHSSVCRRRLTRQYNRLGVVTEKAN